ncbi:hypothetical protein RWE15_03295 [Virgibacillus halophilus]|uniref:Uncharacterized protein n=1 Tax=Tigheibacillus halophilus TaxID=361280 RepID=A0ABU5C485_9BACI|nr:hypothetical protein [Virgibacillus halophilus]
MDQLFGDKLNIIGVFDAAHMQEHVIEPPCQLVLSTIPLTVKKNCPVMTVNPLLPLKDQEKLQTFIKKSSNVDSEILSVLPKNDTDNGSNSYSLFGRCDHTTGICATEIIAAYL